MKKLLLLIVIVMCASQVFSQTQFYRKTAKFDTLRVTNVVDSLNVAVLNLTGSLRGNDALADTAAFEGNAATDTVTITGAAATNLYIATVVVAAAADTVSALMIQPTATGFVMHRTAATVEANQKYFWMRIKR